MPIDQSIRTAVQLTAEARAAADIVTAGYGLAAYLPDNENYGLTFSFDVNQVNLAEAASYRTFGAESRYGSDRGGQSRAGKLPPISQKRRVDEYEQLSLFNQLDAIGGKLEEKARAVGVAIAARAELARGQAVETGTVLLQENGLNFALDFGRLPAHTVTAATLWSAAGAKPLDDLLTWAGVYAAAGNGTPAVTRMSTRIMQTLSRNSDIISAAVRSSANLPSRISLDDVRSVLSSYGFGRVEIRDDQVRVDGVARKVISDDKIVFLPDPDGVGVVDGGVLGTTDYGIPAEAIQPAYGIADSDRPGIFAGDFRREDPEEHNVLGSAIMLPVLANANATFAADVL